MAMLSDCLEIRVGGNTFQPAFSPAHGDALRMLPARHQSAMRKASMGRVKVSVRTARAMRRAEAGMRTHSDESASAGGLKQTQFTCNVQIHHKDINGFSSENSEEFTPSVPFYNSFQTLF